MSAAVTSPGYTGASLSERLTNPAFLLLPAGIFLGFIYLLPVIDLVRLSVSGPTWTVFFERVFSVPLYRDSLVRTMQIALEVSALCLLFGYPTALLIRRCSGIRLGFLSRPR